MESDPLEPLLPGTGKNSPAEGCSGSGSGSGISERSRTPARRPPPPPPPPPPPRPLSELGLGNAKNRVISSSSPSLPVSDIAKNQLAFSSSPSLHLGGVSDSDLEAPGRTAHQTPPAPSSSHGDENGARISSPATRNRQDPSSSGASWNLFGRLRRRAPPHLPLSTPPGSGRCNPFRGSIQELRQTGPRLDSVGVERVIGIFGFSLFGSLSLFPYTIESVKDFADGRKSVVLLSFSFIWVLATVGALSGLQGKSNLEQAFCRFTARLGVVGLALLVSLHVWWALPSINTYYTVGFFILLALPLLLHLVSWAWSWSVGEERMEDKASPDAAQG